MRKIVLGVSSIIFLALAILIIFKGIALKSVKIANVNSIKQNIQDLDDKIFNINVLSNSSYPTAKSSLTSKTTVLENARLKYETMKRNVNTDIIDKYKVEYLWALIGNYASTENLELELVFNPGAIEETYNLDFTLAGDYINVIDFIEYLEEDPELKFEISNFSMESLIKTDRYNKNNQIQVLITKFTVKNIYVIF